MASESDQRDAAEYAAGNMCAWGGGGGPRPHLVEADRVLCLKKCAGGGGEIQGVHLVAALSAPLLRETKGG